MKDTPGTVYLLHFEKPIGNLNNSRGTAQHYIGWTQNLEKRLKEHRKGWSGSGIMMALKAYGVKFVLARTWEGTPEFEKKLKARKDAPSLCPICKKQKGIKP